MQQIHHDLLRHAEPHIKRLGELAQSHENSGRMSPEGVAALVATGACKLFVPKSMGGFEETIPTMIALLERIAQGDGAAGWCAMIAATSSLMAAWVPESVGREVFGAPDAIACGVFAPTGVATVFDDLIQIRGHWSFASGCEHSPWRMVGVVLRDPHADATKPPPMRCVLLRSEETSVVRNWDVLGMRATGSHDLKVEQVTVSQERVFSLLDAPKNGGVAYKVPVFGLLAAGVAAVALGIAEAAVKRFVEIANHKIPQGSKRPMSHRESIQIVYARSVSRLKAARNGLMVAAHDAQESALHDGVTLEIRAALRLAACHATRESAHVVNDLYECTGASAIRASEPLQRCFRDVHVTTQHAMVSDAVAAMAAKVLLGVETDTSML
jgi:indole-3-acetate monooxygenase